MDLAARQRELRKRTREAYTPWKQKQNNHWDALTGFIYSTPTWEGLQQQIVRKQPANVDAQMFNAYAVNRWFNFWSARGVEEIFCTLPGVQAAKNKRDRLVDFSINGVNFDHKTSVFPKNFPHSLQYARENPEILVRWLYRNQSRQQRMHFKNRLFVILYDTYTGAHWKLRAELLWLRSKIERYVRQFDPAQLISLQFEQNSITYSDIIWAVR